MDNIKLGACPCCDKEIEVIEGKVVEVEKPEEWSFEGVESPMKGHWTFGELNGPLGAPFRLPSMNTVPWGKAHVYLHKSREHITFPAAIDHKTKTIYIGKERIK